MKIGSWVRQYQGLQDVLTGYLFILLTLPQKGWMRNYGQ